MDGAGPVAEAIPDSADDTLDARGLLCPIPVLKARKRLARLRSGEVLKLLADDPAAVVDVPFFCMEGGHNLLHHGGTLDAQVYMIRKV